MKDINTNKVTLWFAKRVDEYITIFDVNEDNKNNDYLCPVCSSKVIPKSFRDINLNSAHFAHDDKDKCSVESLIHWCYKNNFLINGSVFGIKDKETDSVTQYTCDKVFIEQRHELVDGYYQPDVTVHTTNGETFFFEMNYKNKKKVEDYINIWLELGNPVVEVDIKDLLTLNTDDVKLIFEPLFMNGKCYGKPSRKSKTFETIFELKETIYSGRKNDDARNFINKFDWFWNDMSKYKLNEFTIEDVYPSIDYIMVNTNNNEFNYIKTMIKNIKCNDIFEKYNEYRVLIIENNLNDIFANNHTFDWYNFEIKRYNDSVQVYIKSKFEDLYNRECFDVARDSLLESIFIKIKKYVFDEELRKKHFTSYISKNIHYDFSNLFGDKTIYLSVDYNDYESKNGIYKKLNNYDFIESVKDLEEMEKDVKSFLEFKKEKILINVNNFISVPNIELKVSNQSIDKKIIGYIYPIYTTAKMLNNNVINFILNAKFTKGEDGRTRRWLIEDFLDAIECVGIENIKSHRDNNEWRDNN